MTGQTIQKASPDSKGGKINRKGNELESFLQSTLSISLVANHCYHKAMRTLPSDLHTHPISITHQVTCIAHSESRSPHTPEEKDDILKPVCCSGEAAVQGKSVIALLKQESGSEDTIIHMQV